MAKKIDTTSFYRRIIGDSLKIAWMHKQLWIFGFFATLIGFGGVSEVFFTAIERTAQTMPLAAAQSVSFWTLIPGYTTVRAIIDYSTVPAVALVVFAILFVIIATVFAWMSLVSVGGLVSSARKISRGGEPTFGDGVKAGSEAFWRLLGLNILTKTILFGALFISSANLYALMRDGSLTSSLFYLGSFMLLVAVSFVAALIESFGSVYVTVKNADIRNALSSSLAMIRLHWLIALEMAVMLLVTTVVIGAATGLVVMVLSVPFIFLIAIASLLQAIGAIYALITLSAAFLIISVICMGSFITSVQATAWTLLWSELEERRASGILHRLAHRIASYFG
jgi:hypothetical protein